MIFGFLTSETDEISMTRLITEIVSLIPKEGWLKTFQKREKDWKCLSNIKGTYLTNWLFRKFN